MARTLKTRIETKDATQTGLRSAESGFSRMGRAAIALNQSLMLVMAAFRAISGTVKDVISAAATQESAELKLAAALRLTGDATASNMREFKEFASGIQEVTIYGDEMLLGLMATAKSMGVSTDKLKEATVAAIGLSKAYNKSLGGAIEYVAQASNGNTMMLQRLIPELMNASTEAEAFAMVLDIGASNISLATEETETYSGALEQLEGVWGDLKEKMGEGFADPGFLKWLKDCVTWMQKFVDYERMGIYRMIRKIQSGGKLSDEETAAEWFEHERKRKERGAGEGVGGASPPPEGEESGTEKKAREAQSKKSKRQVEADIEREMRIEEGAAEVASNKREIKRKALLKRLDAKKVRTAEEYAKSSAGTQARIAALSGTTDMSHADELRRQALDPSARSEAAEAAKQEAKDEKKFQRLLRGAQRHMTGRGRVGKRGMSKAQAAAWESNLETERVQEAQAAIEALQKSAMEAQINSEATLKSIDEKMSQLTEA